MSRQGLEKVLAELETQLESVEDLAPDQVVRLRAAADELRAAIVHEGDEPPSDMDAGLLSQQWDDATRSFTASHPVLAGTIGRIADLLSQIGI